MNVQGVNRGMDELKNEYINKWVLESRMPASLHLVEYLEWTERGTNHMADMKDLLSNYIGFTNDGNEIKAFV